MPHQPPDPPDEPAVQPTRRSLDPELRAIRTIVDALEALPQTVRTRVVSYIADRYSVEVHGAD